MGRGVAAQKRRLDELWRRIQQRHGMLTADEVERLTGTCQAEAFGLLAVTRAGTRLYPGFQFSDGQVRPGWHDLTRPLLEEGWTPEEVLLWFGAPTGWLDGRSPADVLDISLDDVREAVKQAALGPVD